MRTPLVLTATIHPRAVPHMVLRNPAERWRQYRAALSFWLTRPGLREYVFCENSGAAVDYQPLLALAKAYGKTLELVLFDDNAAAQRYGKGYGEGDLLARAWAHSALLAGADGFYKVTGRLIVLNFDRIERVARRRPAVFANRFLGQADWVDTRFFKVSAPLFRERLQDAHRSVTELGPPSRRWALGQAYAQALSGLSLPSFFPMPQYRGMSGYGLVYEDPAWKLWIKSGLCLAGAYRIGRAHARPDAPGP